MRSLLLFLFLISLTQSIHAKVLKYKVLGRDNRPFSFKEVCDSVGRKDVLFATADTVSKLDCMARKVDVTKFCEKRLEGDKRLLRGIIDKARSKVFCQRGDDVHLIVDCLGDNRKLYCDNTKVGCLKLSYAFARNLSLTSHSLLSKEKGEIDLNCIFSTSGISKIDMPIKRKK